MHLKLLLSLCAIAIASVADAGLVRIPLLRDGPALDEYTMVVESVARAEMYRNMRNNDPDHVYYEGLGDFYRNGSWRVINRLPRSPAELQTKFLLITSTSQNYQTAEVLDYTTPSTIASSTFDKDAITRVYSHGFTEHGNGRNGWLVRDNMFAQGEKINFIMVDWGRAAAPPDYWQAAGNAVLVGAQLARTIQLLVELKGARMDKIELIGFSLGAQLSAFTAQRLTQYGVEAPIKRLIAIDPAGPFFENSDVIARLSPDDAEFVEVIHGNGANLMAGGLGMFRQAGHLDFYPNGGQYQPGCTNMIWGALGDIFSGNFGEIPETVICNHYRPFELFLESFSPLPCEFQTFPCDTYDNFRKGACRTPEYHNLGASMDFYAERKPSVHKQFYTTTAQSRFCSRHIFVKIDGAKNWNKETVGIVKVTLADSTGKTETVTVLDNERLKPGNSASGVVTSSIRVEDVVSVVVNYEAKCSWTTWNCQSTLKLDAVHVETMDGLVRKVACAQDGFTLTSGQSTEAVLVKDDQC